MRKQKHLRTQDELCIREQLNKMSKEELIERHLYKMRRLGNVTGLFLLMILVALCALVIVMPNNYAGLQETKNSQIEALAEHICLSNYNDQLQKRSY